MVGTGGRDGRDRPATGAAVTVAPAKLTLSLRVTGRRADGLHLIEAEMVSVDLADRLVIEPSGQGLEVVAADGARAVGLGGADNLVSRALVAVGRTAAVRLCKHVPVGGGLGGGSSDAAAILRWAGCTDPAVAASLGADVPFCLVGGRAKVGGIGEEVSPLPYEQRSFLLLVPPFGVDTGAVYRAWDRLAGAGGPPTGAPNDLAPAALAVEPRLRRWRDAFGAATGREPTLAGSGSTWWVEGKASELGMEGRATLAVGRSEGRVIAVETVPAGWTGPAATGDSG